MGYGERAGADDFARRREEMVQRQIAARGVQSARVLEAMGKVRREGYVPSYLGEFAYTDAPLPIEEEQTISQPYIVAYMVDALRLEPHERVLEIGTGSGYAAAVLGLVAAEVFTIERHERLARTAAERLQRDGYRNVHVRHGDGTLGWPEKAPFDAIVVAAGGPTVPDSLKEQLAVGGRLVIPVGAHGLQKLVRVTRLGSDRFRREELADVRFVPLIGAQGFRAEGPETPVPARAGKVATLVAESCEPFHELADADLEPLLARIGDARVVLLGEATHGTSEFYRFRTRLTQQLVREKGFTIVAVEADWPDAARIDAHVRGREELGPAPKRPPFARFPTWMWRNRETLELIEWLREHNGRVDRERRVRFAGLDLYALYGSIDAVLRYLDANDPEAAAVARHRYGCLTPWQRDPAAYGHAALRGSYRSCEQEVLKTLEDLLRRRVGEADREDERLFDALQDARVVVDAEAYYRVMYYGAAESWNLRDRHMFVCLQKLLEFHGPEARAVVWAHNSHLGDASATDMAARGEWNLGQLCRQEFGARCYSIGFGTDHGTVAAASHWGGPMQILQVRPSHERSYERLCHDSAVQRFLLPLRQPLRAGLRDELLASRLERAIGVIYRPETELASHYFHAVLPRQFDEYVWFDRTSAVHALDADGDGAGAPAQDPAETWPFGL